MTLSLKKRIDYWLGGLLIGLAKPAVVLAGWLLRRDHDPRPRGEIVVVKLLGGGSLVLAAPALLGIRRTWPAHRLTLLTTPGVAPFAGVLGLFDRVEVIDDRSLRSLVTSALRSFWRVIGVDTVVDLEVYSRLASVLSLATLARNRIGFYLEAVFWRRHLNSHLLFFNRFSPVHVFYGHVARLLGATPSSRAECEKAMRTTLPPNPRPRVAGRRRVALGHACSELGQERMLSPAEWRAVLARHAKLEEAEIFLLGGAGDREFAEAIVTACAPALPTVQWHNACGELSLGASLALLATCDEFIGIDSALLHFARLFAVPTTSFWGPTDPMTRLQPFGETADVVHYRKIACSPCIHVAEDPPCAGRNVCIAALVHPEGETAETEPMWVVRH